MGRDSYSVKYKDLAGVVSLIPYAEPQPSLENIVAHEKVVNATKKHGTVLPVKFGVIFRNEEGVKALLAASYEAYAAKLEKFEGVDEYGIKVVLKTEGMKKLREKLGRNSKEISAMRKKVAKASPGRSYFLKMKMDEAIKAESYREVDKLAREIHGEISKGAEENLVLKSEHDQIILNAAYLVQRKKGDSFLSQARSLEKAYAPLGVMIHTSGPWAPYSFVEAEPK